MKLYITVQTAKGERDYLILHTTSAHIEMFCFFSVEVFVADMLESLS